MTDQDFLAAVAERTGTDQRQAERLARAFLQTLAQRLGNDEARDLASQLPTELQDCLAPTQPEVEKLSNDEFLARLGKTAGVGPAEAEQAAHAVWEVLGQAITGDVLRDVRSQLPSELLDLFEEHRAPNPAHDM